MSKNDVVQRAWTELEPHVVEQGYELLEIEFGQYSGRWILRLYIDGANGVTLDDCTAVSQLVNPILDAADFVSGHYALEVSSPGIDRPIRKPADFERYIGERIKMKTHAPVLGRKRFTGVLSGYHDGMVVVECDGNPYECHLENIIKANLDR